MALLFQSAEYYVLLIVGLSAIAAFAGTVKVIKLLMMTEIGLLLIFLPAYRRRCALFQR